MIQSTADQGANIALIPMPLDDQYAITKVATARVANEVAMNVRPMRERGADIQLYLNKFWWL